MDKWLRNANVVKVIALAIGVLLWAIVRMDQQGTPGNSENDTFMNEQTIGNVNITPIYNEEQFHIVEMDPSEVTIKVQGRPSQLRRVSDLGNYRIVADLTRAKTGENMLPLIPEDFPAGVHVTIYPPYVRVVLEEMQKKQMPVEVSLIGEPAAGYMAGQPVVNPQRVHVTVPASRMDDVASVRAEVHLDNAQATVSTQAKLVAYDKNGNKLDVSIDPAVVDIEVPITQPFKMMPMRLKIVGEPAAGFAVASFRASVDQITVYGPQDVLNGLEFYEGPQINLTGLTEDKTFTLDIPRQNNVTSVEPSKVEVTVEIVPSVTKTFEAVPITIVGQNDQYGTKIVDPQDGVLNVTVEAAPAVLEQLKPQDVQAVVNVGNLPPGRHDVPVTISLPQFVKRLGPDRVTVEIAAKTSSPASTAPSGTEDTSGSSKTTAEQNPPSAPASP